MPVRAVKIVNGYRTSVNVEVYGDNNTVPVTFQGNPASTKFTVNNQVLENNTTYYFIPGNYTYIATAEGYQASTGSFTLGNTALTVYATLTSGASSEGVVVVDSQPQGAQVYLDQNYRGSTPLTINNVAVGSHGLKISMSGKQDSIGTFDIQSGETKNITVALQDAFPASGTYVDSICKNVGTYWTLFNRYADGSGGLYETKVKDYAVECGYVPPQSATLLVTSTPGGMPFEVKNSSNQVVYSGVTANGVQATTKSSYPISVSVTPGVYTVNFTTNRTDYKSKSITLNAPVNTSVEAWGQLPSKSYYTVYIDVMVRTEFSAKSSIKWLISGNNLVFNSSGLITTTGGARSAYIGSEARGTDEPTLDFVNYVGLTGNITNVSAARTKTIKGNELCTSNVSDVEVSCSSEQFWASPTNAGAGARLSVSMWSWSDEAPPTNNTTTTISFTTSVGGGGNTTGTNTPPEAS